MYKAKIYESNPLGEPRVLAERTINVQVPGTQLSANVPISVNDHFVPMLHARYKCGRCSVDYLEIDNFELECRYHPLPRNDNGRHKCCNLSDVVLGCTRCDHSPDYQWSNDFNSPSSYVLAIPVELLPLLRQVRRVLQARSCLIVVESFDTEEAHGVALPRQVFPPYGEKRIASLDVQPDTVVQWSHYNNTLRWETFQDSYYDPFKRKFNAYALFLRYERQ